MKTKGFAALELLLGLLVLAILAGGVWAGPVLASDSSFTIIASQDACAYAGAPDSSYPYCLGTAGGEGYYAYLQFKLKNNQGQTLLPAGTSVSDAVLRLYVVAGTFKDKITGIEIYEGSSTFDEQTLTWNNKPALGKLVVSEEEVHFYHNTSHEWHIKDLLTQYFREDKEDLVLIVKTAGPNPEYVQFATEESYESEKKPQLLVWYTLYASLTHSNTNSNTNPYTHTNTQADPYTYADVHSNSKSYTHHDFNPHP